MSYPPPGHRCNPHTCRACYIAAGPVPAKETAMPEETERVKVHRVVLLVVDHDDIGPDELKIVIENTRYPNRCIMPDVMHIETREVDWTERHPLNLISEQARAYREIFELDDRVDRAD